MCNSKSRSKRRKMIKIVTRRVRLGERRVLPEGEGEEGGEGRR